jgi:spore coat protein U-like protein
MLSTTQRKSLSLATVVPFLTWLSVAPAAGVQSYSTQLPVTLTLGATCSLTMGGAGSLNFNLQTAATLAAGAIPAQTTMTVTCTSNSAYTIGMNGGTASSPPGPGLRQLVAQTGSSPNTINYKVCSDGPGCTQIWGDAVSFTSGGALPYSAIGNGSAQTITVYGLIPSVVLPSGQALGVYNDTINVTLNY